MYTDPIRIASAFTYWQVMKFSFLLMLVLNLTACVSVGPSSANRDQYAYANALRTGMHEQLLLNAVALRYGEGPLFLETSSVISQYALEGSVTAGAKFTTGLLSNSQTLGAGAKYREQPTITFSPLTGEKFTRSLLTPIPPESLISMIQSGFPLSFMFSVGVKGINGIIAPSKLRVERAVGSMEFYEIVERLQKIHNSGAVGMRIIKQADGISSVLFFHHNPPAEVLDDIRYLRTRLRLETDRPEFIIRFGSVPQHGNEIVLQTKSMMEILADIGAGATIPQEHLQQGRAQINSVVFEDDPAGIVIHSSKKQPRDAFTAVQFRDYWFWIDDRDYTSKIRFSIIGMMLSLAETGAVRSIPIVTVPTN